MKSGERKSSSKRKGRGVKASPPPNIQIMFGDPNGTSVKGPLVEMSQVPKRRRKHDDDDAAWNQDQSIRRFCRYLQRRNGHGLEAAMRALDRHGCWRQAVNQLQIGPSPNLEKGLALLSFWNTFGLHSVGRGLRDDLPHLIDAFKYLLPPYTGAGLTLYRGEVEARHLRGVYGISWTPIFTKARQFADIRSPDEGHGVVVKLEAKPDMIALAVKDYSQHTLTLGEDEYLVDPRMIKGKVCVVVT